MSLRAGPALSFSVRRLTPGDADTYRDVRLEGLRAYPSAFGTAVEEEAERSSDWFAERLRTNVVFGGWSGAGELLGVAGLMVPQAAKLRHKGLLWGMFVREQARGTGLAAALVAAVIAAARERVEAVNLAVTATNHGAIRLYRAAGFRDYARDAGALKVAGVYHDEILMTLSLLGDGVV